MPSAIGSLDPTYLAILLIGLAGVAVFVLKTIVFDFHPDALVFVVAFGLLLLGVGTAAVDPRLTSSTSRYLYHGAAVMGSGIVMFVMAYARRRMFLETGAEGEEAAVVRGATGGEK